MTIPQIKQQLSIEAVLNHYNLSPNRNGLLNCPFHDDKTPSLQIYPKTNSYCCFSSNCAAGTGDQVQFIELMELKAGRVSGAIKARKHHALQLAKQLLGYKEESLLEVFTRLRLSLQRSKKAQQYAQSRGLDIENLEVGYNGGSYEDLKNCLVFPLKNEHDEIVSLYGRSISESAKTRHFYQKGRTGLYPSYPKSSTEKLILTEGVVDAVSLLQNTELEKEYSVLALYGAKVFNEEQERAIKNLPKLKEIIFFFDGDAAGAEAAKKWQTYLSQILNK